MAKSHTILGCVTLLLTAAAPLAAQASFAEDGDNLIAAQHNTYLPFRAVGMLSSVALFTVLLKTHDNSTGTSHAPTFAAVNGSSVLNQTGSNDSDDSHLGGPDNEHENETETPDVATVPEPGTLALVASGLFGLAGARRRRTSV